MHKNKGTKAKPKILGLATSRFIHDSRKGGGNRNVYFRAGLNKFNQQSSQNVLLSQNLTSGVGLVADNLTEQVRKFGLTIAAVGDPIKNVRPDFKLPGSREAPAESPFRYEGDNVAAFEQLKEDQPHYRLIELVRLKFLISLGVFDRFIVSEDAVRLTGLDLRYGPGLET